MQRGPFARTTRCAAMPAMAQSAFWSLSHGQSFFVSFVLFVIVIVVKTEN
jgi:hypothetical protein